MGFSEATPIQTKAIPALLDGRDIIGQAQTGTGKTIAFAIPAVENISPELGDPQVLVLCPTRELVVQVANEFEKLTETKRDVEVIAIYGGQNISIQLKALKRNKKQIIIGTPGRIMDHQRRGTLNLEYLTTLILDEADQMIDMGFHEDIETILSETPDDRQTVMFSATMNKKLMALMEKFQKNPEHISVMDSQEQSKQIKQLYYEINSRDKTEALKRLIAFYNFDSALIFCNTKIKVDELTEVLLENNYTAAALHGDLDQKKRDKVMAAFRKGAIKFLIATDVAARGIDVDDLSAVINYDFPRFGEDYVHRIGRTGRAGREGLALSFIGRNELEHMRKTARMKKLKLTEAKIPGINDIQRQVLHTIKNDISNVKLEEHDEKLVSQFLELCQEMNLFEDQIFALLLKHLSETKINNLNSKIQFEKPQSSHRERKHHRSGSNKFGGGGGFKKAGKHHKRKPILKSGGGHKKKHRH